MISAVPQQLLLQSSNAYVVLVKRRYDQSVSLADRESESDALLCSAASRKCTFSIGRVYECRARARGRGKRGRNRTVAVTVEGTAGTTHCSRNFRICSSSFYVGFQFSAECFTSYLCAERCIADQNMTALFHVLNE